MPSCPTILNFDNTYIVLFGKTVFEPVTILTNLFILLVCLFAFKRINKFNSKLANSWSWFFLLIGISSQIGSLAHGVHYQLGNTFIFVVVFLMNAVSLLAIYFCYRAAIQHTLKENEKQNKWLELLVILWIIALLGITYMQNSFLLIKIHAGIVLTYSLVMHFITHRRNESGSLFISIGILVSFLSIVTHSLKLSISEWFNYKDISHVIMMISLYLIFLGVQLKLQKGKSDLLHAT